MGRLKSGSGGAGKGMERGYEHFPALALILYHASISGLSIRNGERGALEGGKEE